MAKQKNRYEQKAAKNKFKAMAGHLDTKGSIKNTLIETGKDLLIGVIGGGLVGSAIGKPSLAIGIGVTGLGHYMGNRLVSLAGIGMMAANGFQSTTTVSGVEEEGMQGIKDRVMAFKDTFSQKLYLDKILKKKAATTAGFGELQYFNYANEVAGLAALNSIEDQVQSSALSRLNGGNMGAAEESLPGMGAAEEYISGMNGGLADVSDYNL